MGSDPIPVAKTGSDPDWPNFNVIPAVRYVERRDALVEAYRAIRDHSLVLSSRFSESEQQIQSMPEASPAKWHLAHTTWFFETFILQPFRPGFEWFDRHFCYLFNSYYNAVGAQYPRPRRGLITHPDLDGVRAYRARTDGEMLHLLAQASESNLADMAPTLVLGLNHEQQHQELLLTDIKHALFQTTESPPALNSTTAGYGRHPTKWLELEDCRAGVGYAGEGFCFDNELARHDVLLQPFRIRTHPVSAGEWLAFMDDGGYENPLLWLSDGWQWRQKEGVSAPLYWKLSGGGWTRFTLDGWRAIDPNEVVSHISYYEADAFAEWAGARLPRESEWEVAATGDGGEALGGIGQCWEWTQSAYCAYPGFRPTPGPAGEYNGKFMINQMVLRGSSRATSTFHSRPSYRNFFFPGARWQYSGLRLAEDLP